MRGKVAMPPVKTISARITPAYAGKSVISGVGGEGTTDHPRLCGEKTAVCKFPAAVPGSPPPMRGKGVCPVRAPADLGITPAYAGKSVYVLKNRRGSWDHPRLCGEKSFSHCVAPVMPGSPPPMRGKVLQAILQLNTGRITPAYAGKSGGNDRTYTAEKDHPRLCGEKHQHSFRSVSPVGSPPPMRGKG